MGRSDRKTWDDDLDDEDDPGWDDGQGYGDDDDEEAEYQEFLEREFGHGSGGSRLTRWQYITAIVLLIVFLLPGLLYLWVAIS